MVIHLRKLQILFCTLMAIPVLVVVFTVGNWMGRRDATFSIAVAQSATIYSAEMSGTDLNTLGGKYKKISNWLTLRRQTFGAVQSFLVIKSYAGLYGYPCAARIRVVRDGRTFEESIIYSNDKFVPDGAA